MKTCLAIAALVALAACPMAEGAAAEVHVFDIPAGSAELAITAFSKQSHRQIVAPGDALLGINVPCIRGEFDTAAALAIILKNTTLVVASDDGQTIVLTRAAPSPPPTPVERHAAVIHDKHPAEAVIVTGYRASLTNATNLKRETVGLIDAIFAEDIGKFPDTNIAESLNRVPGILLTRDADGEGVLIAVRGLSTNFTKILLNDAPIAVATSGVLDSGNNNREVDLNMFPGELFTSLTVSKTPRAELTEGGAAGTVNMRTRRPFDQSGTHLTYVMQGIDNSLTNGMGAAGALIASSTWDTHTLLGSVGVLVGIAGQHTYTMTRGWEDGNAGWVTPSIINSTLCGATSGCDLPGSTVSIGGNAMTIAPAIPANVTIPGYAPGTTTNAALLLALNPGLNMTQISNMLLPRLPRPMYQRGTRDRYNIVASIEALPTDTAHIYVDFIFGRRFNDLDRTDISWGVRAGNGAQPAIPMNVVLDQNGVVASGRFANAQFGLEARPYNEGSDFFSVNPGLSWQPTDLLALDIQVNASRSHYKQDSPTFYFATCPSAGNAPGIPGCAAPAGGVFVDFTNPKSGGVPTIATNIDLNDPANFQWSGGRAQIRDEKRFTAIYGAHFDISYGGALALIKIGAAYDVQYRSIVAIDFLESWQQQICGGGVSVACTGAPGSLVPQSSLSQYLYPGPLGFVSVDYASLKAASNYHAINDPTIGAIRHHCVHQPAGNRFSPSGMTGATSGCIEERTAGLYGQFDGGFPIAGHDFKYDLGLRWVQTRQSIRSPVKRTNGDFDFSDALHTYQAFLPSMNLVFEITDGLLAKGALSRTMTRANAAQMIAVVNYTDVTGQEAQVGNPSLQPYYSNNADFALEYYTQDDGFLSIALFKKWIGGFTTNQIVSQPLSYLAQYGITWDTLTSVQRQALFDRSGCTSDAHCPAQINVSLSLNAPGIETISGLELSYVQSLDPVFEQYGLSGFGLIGNLTVIDQASSGSAATHAMNVAPYTYNLTGYYERNGIMVRLSYSFMDRTYGSVSNQQNVCLPTSQAASAGCPQGAYLFGAPFGQVDYSSSLKLSNVFGELPSDPEITLNVQNVMNAKRHSYFQFQNAYHAQYESGRTFMFGVHGTF